MWCNHDLGAYACAQIQRWIRRIGRNKGIFAVSAANRSIRCRVSARHVKPRVTRYLSPELRLKVKTYIQGVPRDTGRKRDRARALYPPLSEGLRITEVGENADRRFFRGRDADGEDRRRFDAWGEGGEERLVLATAKIIMELGAYHHERRQPAMPSSDEDTPRRAANRPAG
jgi:integrase/recombinase XerD